MAFSIISTPDLPGYRRVCQLEHLSSPAEKRFRAMEQLARAGIVTGTSFMPILLGLGDDAATVRDVVRWTVEHGGQFVLAGGLTLADQQRDYFFDVLKERFPDLLSTYRRLYPPGSYGPPSWNWRTVALQVKEACLRYGIRDRVPRPIAPEEARARNKRIVEALANTAYDMDLRSEPARRVWAYRKAAWAVEVMFRGDKINATEQRAVLHVALRALR